MSCGATSRAPYSVRGACKDRGSAGIHRRLWKIGDRDGWALRLFAQTLCTSLRDGDLAARWGGEEFVLVLPHSGASQAQEAVDRVRAKLAENLLAGGTPAFTASFGISDTTMSSHFEQLLRMADEALYCAKESGRDRAMIAGQHGSTAGPPQP